MKADFKTLNSTGFTIPSAALPLEGGALLVADDDRRNPPAFSLLTAGSGGRFKATSCDYDGPSLGRLRGLASLDGWGYGVTSFRQGRKGARRLVRFRMEEGRLVRVEKARKGGGLEKRVRDLFKANWGTRRWKKPFRVAGMAPARRDKELLIALWRPLIRKDDVRQAVVVKTKGLVDAFGPNASPLRISYNIRLLNLKGARIRDLAAIPDWKGFLLLSASDKPVEIPGGGRARHILWFWDGEGAPRELFFFPMGGARLYPHTLAVTQSRRGPTLVVLGGLGPAKQGARKGEKGKGRYWRLTASAMAELKARIGNPG